jgi:hypothetical protein
MEKSKLGEISIIIIVSIVALLFIIYILWCIYTVICAMRDQNAVFNLIKFNDRKAVKNPIHVLHDTNDIISRTELEPIQIVLVSKGPIAESGNRYFFKYEYTLFYGENFQQEIKKGQMNYLTTGFLNDKSLIYFEDNIVYGTRHSIGIPIPLFDYLQDENTPLQISVTRTIYYTNINPTGVTSLDLVTSPVLETIINTVSTVLLKDHENVTSNFILFEEVV